MYLNRVILVLIISMVCFSPVSVTALDSETVQSSGTSEPSSLSSEDQSKSIFGFDLVEGGISYEITDKISFDMCGGDATTEEITEPLNTEDRIHDYLKIIFSMGYTF